MRKILLILYILMIPLYIMADVGSDNRGVNVQISTLDKQKAAGKQYLLLIAIDKYKEWNSLKNPVKDALEIKSILTSRYYIDYVFELYNEKATKENILRLFAQLKQRLRMEDSLLIFYAGHGNLDENSQTGFLIPSNAGKNAYEQANWLPLTQVRGLIAGLEAIHILLISDSCFAGNLLAINRGPSPPINNEYFKKAYSLVSRQVLTSGGLEVVPDESVFAYQLKLSLKKNTSPYLDPLMLYQDIRLGIRDTTPLFGNLKDCGHQEGAGFLLFLKLNFRTF